MLSWTQGTDGWYANGYRISSAAPFRWLLETTHHPTDDEPKVSAIAEPLAVGKTFSECKREAELIEAARVRVNLVRRSVMQLASMFAIAALLSASSAEGLAVWLAVGLVAVVPAKRLVATLLWRFGDPTEDLFYQ